MISWKMGDLSGELPHRFVFSLNVGTGAFLPPCAIIGALLLPQEVSWLPPLPTSMLKGLCNHVGNWVRGMIQLKAVLSDIESRF